MFSKRTQILSVCWYPGEREEKIIPSGLQKNFYCRKGGRYFQILSTFSKFFSNSTLNVHYLVFFHHFLNLTSLAGEGYIAVLT
jgi:hypothetical protein